MRHNNYKYREKTDCVLEFDYRFWAERHPSYTARFGLIDHRPVQIGNYCPTVGDWLIGVPVSIILDTYPSIAKESHIAFFIPEDWDKIISSVRLGQKATLQDAVIRYNETTYNREIVNTIEHWDYGDQYGHEIGVWKEYYPGQVISAASLEISYKIDFQGASDLNNSELSTCTSDYLIGEAIDIRGEEPPRHPLSLDDEENLP